jgi:hypothetical protein
MARVAFTDFSGLKPVKMPESRTRTYLFVETPSVLDPPEYRLPASGVVLNGALVQFETRLTQEQGGWLAEVDVVADTLEPNTSFAEFYFNQTLDVAALRHASPFQVLPRSDATSSAGQTRFHNTSTSAVVTPEDFDQSARLAFLLYTLETDLLRSIGWYRRGLSSPDTLLSFLGLWNSIEIAAARFCQKNDKTDKGSKNQIFQLLTDYLPKSGIQFFKPNTEELDEWITKNYDMRLQIAHGLGSTDLSIFRNSEVMIPKLRSVSTALLRVLADARCKDNQDIVSAIQQAERIKEAYARQP